MTQPTGAPTNPPADPGNSPPTNAPPQNDPSPTPPQPIQTVPPQTDPAKGEDQSAARIAALEEQLRGITAKNEKSETILQQLAGILNPDKQPSPEELTATLRARDDELKAKTLELAVLSVAGTQAGGTLLDSRRFLDSIKGMEPGTDAFKAKVQEAVSKLSPTQTAPPGTPTKGAGADLSGGKGGEGKEQLTREQLAGMSHKEIMEAYRNGQLNDLAGTKK